MAIDYSVIIPAFIDAFATRASYDDVTYCDTFAQSKKLDPKVCKALTTIAKDGQISAEEAKTFDSDSQKFIAGIAGRDGKTLQWARITYLQDHAVTKLLRWDADDKARARMARELGNYPGYPLTGENAKILENLARNDDSNLVRGMAMFAFYTYIERTRNLDQDLDSMKVLVRCFQNDSDYTNSGMALEGMLLLIEKYPEIKPIIFDLIRNKSDWVGRASAIRVLSTQAGKDPDVRAFIADRAKNDDVPYVRTVATTDLESLQLPQHLK